MSELTSDACLDGRLQIAQARDGYRFSIDAVLLAALPRPKPGDYLIDLGTGCGIIPLIVAYRHPHVEFLSVEMQAQLADLARANVEANQMQGRIRVVQGDMRLLSPGDLQRPADWVLTNPPYRRSRSGRINPNSQRAAARHEIDIDLPGLMQTAGRLLRTGGRFAIIYPGERTVDLLHHMRLAAIEPKWIRPVCSHDGQEAKLILVEGVRNGHPGMVLAPPLVIYSGDGSYTAEVRKMMAP